MLPPQLDTQSPNGSDRSNVNHYWKMKTKSFSRGIQATRGATLKSTYFNRVSRGKFHLVFPRPAFSWLPITYPQASSSSCTHPAAPLKSSPHAPPRQQLLSQPRAASHLEGKRTGTSLRTLPLPPTWGTELGEACVSLCVCIRLFLHAHVQFPFRTKQNSSL